MWRVFEEKTSMLREADKAQFKPPIWLQLLIFVGLYLASILIQIIPMSIGVIIFTFFSGFKNALSGIPPEQALLTLENNQFLITLLSLFLTVIPTIAFILYCRFGEKRSFRSMGFVKSRAISHYFNGLLIGFSMFASSVLIATLTGTLKFNGFSLTPAILGVLILFLFGFILQGMSEEVILRGYLMISIASKKTIMWGVLINSLVFGLLHLANSHISFLSLINLVLFGFFASIYTLKTDNLWGICALHTIWNFSQGNIFGIAVSGLNVGPSIFSFIPTETGTLINGGGFGLEGGLSVTIVLVVATFIMLNQKNASIK